MKKFNKQELLILKKFWKHVENAQEAYINNIDAIENGVQERLGLDIEIFHVDGEAVGYGTYDRDYELLHMPECKYMKDFSVDK